jgi:hypothetical protein
MYSERHGAELHLGKQAPTKIPNAVSFAEVKRTLAKADITLPKTPIRFGHGSDFVIGPVAGGGWGMMGNGPCDDDSVAQGTAAYQGAGDCAWAGPAHEHMMFARNSGHPVPRFTAQSVLEQYSAYSGYDLQTGANDNGSAIADVVGWRQTKGLLDADGNAHKIGQAVELTPGDLNQLWEATWLFESVGVGINVQDQDMHSFDAGLAWDYNPSAQIVGGHYIPTTGRWSWRTEELCGFVTWAERVFWTDSYYQHRNDEAVCYISMDRYNAVTGESAEGFADADLERYITLVAQAKLA